MSTKEKLLFKLLSGNSDSNFDFNDLVTILNWIGFDERKTGSSHRIFYKNGIPDIINIQPNGSKAKAYQVKQIRQLFVKYKLGDYG
jgi:hypothetical protein